MNEAELYENNNGLQKSDAIQTLDKYAKKLMWSLFGDRVIDVGCGGGGVTAILKKKYMPKHFSSILGCDKSKNMIEYANKHHANRSTQFQVLDIVGEIPEALQENFDHVVSFNSLHWIKNQETVFKNIRMLLAENGDCLLLFLGHMPIYDLYRQLSRTSKWGKWLTDVEGFVSPYHDSQEPDKEVFNMLKQNGFENIEVILDPAEFTYSNAKEFRDAVASVNPFYIPDELFDDFIEDIKKAVSSRDVEGTKNNNIEKTFSVTVVYKRLIVYAQKSKKASSKTKKVLEKLRNVCVNFFNCSYYRCC